MFIYNNWLSKFRPPEHKRIAILNPIHQNEITEGNRDLKIDGSGI
jgi:hypothetical protein